METKLTDTKIIDIYRKFSCVLLGCRTIYDALYFAQFYIKNNPECKSLINGMIHGKHYEKVTDFRSIANILNILDNFESQNDIDVYINKNINKDNFDYSQLNALLRLGKTKTYKNYDNTTMENESNISENLSILSENINKNLSGLINNNSYMDLQEITSCDKLN